MAQTVIQMIDLPDDPLDAAAHFLSEHVPLARDLLKNGLPRFPGAAGDAPELDALAFVFPPAGKEHQGWRLAAIQALAREAAPRRVNGVVGPDSDEVDQIAEWLADAPGITGQLLSLQTG